MQEWIKELLGEAYTPQLEEALAAELARRFLNREELDAARTQAADWKKKAEQAQKTAEEQVAAVRFDAQLNAAIGKAGGRSEKAIRALLDLDGLRASGDRKTAIAAALEQLEQENVISSAALPRPPMRRAPARPCRAASRMKPCAGPSGWAVSDRLTPRPRGPPAALPRRFI